MMRGRRVVALVALVFAVSGCSRTAVADITISLDNLTDTPIGLYVNGEWVGTYPAGATTEQPLGDHGGAPYSVEARSGSGAVLATVGVNEAQAQTPAQAGQGLAVEQGVPCGIVRIVVGELGPDAVPAPAASVSPGPCP
ncbi:MAG: hypothetical protein ABIP77_01290 [Candidatus Limnocylindrales bacterium]